MTGAIFDLDGTLLDSMAIWDSFGAEYLQSRNLIPPKNLYKILKPMSLLQAAQYFRNYFRLADTTDEIMQQFNDRIDDKYQFKIMLKPHVSEFLEKLKNRDVKMCVATATDRRQTEAALKNLGVDHYFSFILTCTEVGSGKDQPKIFEQALERLGTSKDETIVFEDALHAITTAKEAGFRVIGVYDPSAEEDVKQIKQIADDYIYSFAECEVSKL
jgi:HAD superfamily hydrolase (TIGR01509 family)